MNLKDIISGNIVKGRSEDDSGYVWMYSCRGNNCKMRLLEVGEIAVRRRGSCANWEK